MPRDRGWTMGLAGVGWALTLHGVLAAHGGPLLLPLDPVVAGGDLMIVSSTALCDRVSWLLDHAAVGPGPMPSRPCAVRSRRIGCCRR